MGWPSTLVLPPYFHFGDRDVPFGEERAREQITRQVAGRVEPVGVAGVAGSEAQLESPVRMRDLGVVAVDAVTGIVQRLHPPVVEAEAEVSGPRQRPPHVHALVRAEAEPAGEV